VWQNFINYVVREDMSLQRVSQPQAGSGFRSRRKSEDHMTASPLIPPPTLPNQHDARPDPDPAGLDESGGAKSNGRVKTAFADLAAALGLDKDDDDG